MLQLPDSPLYKVGSKNIHLKSQHFIITKVALSRGAQGQIDLAQCKVDGQSVRNGTPIPKDVVIKRIETSRLQKQPKELKYLRFELETPYVLEHKGIVQYVTHYQDRHNVYIVQQYVPGKNLFQRISRQGKFTLRDTARYGRQIIEALMYLHKRSIMHRDIKLENILISSKTNSVKLVDFGYSCIVDQYRDTCCGTRVYMAPEVRKKHPYSFPAEVWAVGVLMYEMLAGILNVDKFNPDVARFQYPIGFPYQAREIIERMVIKDPERRIKFQDVLKGRMFNLPPPVMEERKDISKILSESQSPKSDNRKSNGNIVIQTVSQGEITKLRADLNKLQAVLRDKEERIFKESLQAKKSKEREVRLRSELEEAQRLIEEKDTNLKQANQRIKSIEGQVQKKDSLVIKLSELQMELDKTKTALEVANAEREEAKKLAITREGQIAVEKQNYEDLLLQKRKVETNYQQLSHSMNSIKQNGNSNHTNSIDVYFKSRIVEIEKQVSESRILLNGLQAADRAFDMERKSHIDQNQAQLERLTRIVGEERESVLKEIQFSSIERKLYLKQEECERLREQLDEQAQDLKNAQLELGKGRQAQEELKSLHSAYGDLDEQLAFKEDWIQTLNLTISELEKKHAADLHYRSSIFQDDYMDKMS